MMSNNNINPDSHIISLADIKIEDNPGNSPDSEELLLKKNRDEKLKEPINSNKPPLGKEPSMSFNMKSDEDEHLTYSIKCKGKGSKLYSDPSSSVISDIEGDPDNLSITTSIITDTSDTNNINNRRQSVTQSLRNKRFSYNSPSSSTAYQWNNPNIANNTAMDGPSSSSNTITTNNNINTNSNDNNISNNNNNNNNNSNSNARPPLSNLSGTFAEFLSKTSNALANNANASSSNNNATTTTTTNNNNSSSNNVPGTSSSRHGSVNSNMQQNFYRIGLSENINIETTDPISVDSDSNDRPSQVGPGIAAWLCFRIYAIIRFMWSLTFCTIYFVHFVVKKSKSCDEKIYIYSIVFAIIFGIQAISSLLLIIYLPTSITRYTNVIRRRVVISSRAWKITSLTFLGEIVMVIVGAILVFNKDQKCSTDIDTTYVYITKSIVIIVICLYTLLLLPIFIIPCAITFKLLPEYRGISKKVLKRFNSILYNPSEEVSEEDAPMCSICMENYKPGTRIKRLPCNHEFHPECITPWLETNNSCPICRQTFN
ncbi:hypothetical protein H8356DRAFT_1682320 [Neocallimastix lanati (nom. inval.)]|nr:hypothetical protein H8356DRAFT_1682320 [Neocallimastix sp. JGI-2020a]